MKKLRLLLFSECDRHCVGCCNDDWDLGALPACRDYSGFDMIMLTGGEPLLRPDLVRQAVREIQSETDAPIYLYTAKVDTITETLSILLLIDGMTVTLHEQDDVRIWKRFDTAIALTQRAHITISKSLRLNVFKGVNLEGTRTAGWIVKTGIEWVVDCPLPEGETFMRWTPAQ